MRLKALRQEKQLNTTNTGNLIERNKKGQDAAKKQPTAKPSGHVRCTSRGMQINKMLNYGLNREQIIDVLNLTGGLVDNTMKRFCLPRPNSDLVPLKD